MPRPKPFDLADLLALLEERPYTVRELAVIFECSAKSVYHVLHGSDHVTQLLHGQWALRPVAPAAVPTPAPPKRLPRRDDDEFVSIWNGRDPLPGSGDAKGLGSTLSGADFRVRR